MVRLEENKNLTEHKAIKRMILPKRVYIPLSQHAGKICTVMVKPQDRVLLGQPVGNSDVKVFAPVHSSVSGKVVSIDEWPHPVLGRSKALCIFLS